MAQQFTPATLGTMQGHVLLMRPGIEPVLVRDFLNQAVRWALDYKLAWAGTLRHDALTVPDVVTGGTITVTNGSKTVTLSGSTWPTADLSDTTTAAAIVEPGRHWVTLTSMSGVTTDSILVLDTGASREVLRVYQTRANSIRTDVAYAHQSGATVKQSSIAGRQMRIGEEYVTYTIESVNSSTQLTLTVPWAGASGSAMSYEIVKMYYSISPDVKFIQGIGDPKHGMILKHEVSQAELTFRDPQRRAIGWPLIFAAIGPGPAGNMQHELYPIQREALQLDALYSIQWPDMVAQNDTPPPFINPDVFTYKALAMAKMYRRDKTDPYYDPAAARDYEFRAKEALVASSMADDAKLSQQLEFFFRRYRQVGVRGGADWMQRSDASAWDYGSMWW